ncbi:MAG: type II toxin-antitoxin system VapC family toxin [Sciscionella sp.]
MGTVVLDSSIVLGFLERGDAHNATATSVVRELHADGFTFLLPSTVLAEVLVGESRRGESSVTKRRAMLRQVFGPTRVIDDNVAAHAAQLRATHRSLRLPDALVIATGIVEDAASILTADKRWAAVDDRVRVIEPG